MKKYIKNIYFDIFYKKNYDKIQLNILNRQCKDIIELLSIKYNNNIININIYENNKN